MKNLKIRIYILLTSFFLFVGNGSALMNADVFYTLDTGVFNLANNSWQLTGTFSISDADYTNMATITDNELLSLSATLTNLTIPNPVNSYTFTLADLPNSTDPFIYTVGDLFMTELDLRSAPIGALGNVWWIADNNLGSSDIVSDVYGHGGQTKNTNIISTQVQLVEVPETGTYVLLASALGLMMLIHVCRKRRASCL